ncbi:anaphase-promoting complex subunit 11 RING-H2 finger protein [Medicago truncatula]|uniref:Anaphase-promoting complex subunit 11 RING-H2 finger protein n=2 Tax=Medicago truncatula TaxID=3880 RepID=A0A072VQW0_MEDTR|nr:anaphase-promoting complex subunit 11 RING-H2 finger protein [Medicago truncatula]
MTSSNKSYFYIRFYHCQSTSFICYYFLIPGSILSIYDVSECSNPNSYTNMYLLNTFSIVPIPSEVLKHALLRMGEYARNMITVNIEERHILEMSVTVHDVTNVMNSLEKIKVDDNADTACSMEQCSICLKEFYNETEVPAIVRTKCMHVFHQQCVARWLMQCCISNRLYSCPLCRSEIQ